MIYRYPTNNFSGMSIMEWKLVPLRGKQDKVLKRKIICGVKDGKFLIEMILGAT